MKNNSPENMMAAVSKSLQERTGRTLEEWVEQVLKSGLDPIDQNTVRKWLKTEHGLLQNSQWAIADAAAQAAGWLPPTVEEYINSQYAGPKAALRPIFDQIRHLVESFGPDVTLEGRNGYTPFVRKRRFMSIQVASKDRIDIGLRYKAAPISSLLSEAQAPGQATHKISLKSVDDITDEVITLLRTAYEQNG